MMLSKVGDEFLNALNLTSEGGGLYIAVFNGGKEWKVIHPSKLSCFGILLCIELKEGHVLKTFVAC